MRSYKSAQELSFVFIEDCVSEQIFFPFKISSQKINTQEKMSIPLALLVLFILTLPRHCSGAGNDTNNKTLVNIALMLRDSGDEWGYGSAVKLCKSLIEKSDQFKYFNDRYEMMVTTKYDSYQRSMAITNTYEFAHKVKPEPIAFIGPMKTENAMFAATTLGLYRWLFVTAASNVDTQYGTLRILSSSTGIDQEVKARITFLRKFKWKRVAFVYSLRMHQNAATYLDKMMDLFKKYGIDLIGRAGIEVRKNHLENNLDLLRTKLEALKKNDTKIFIAEIGPYEALVLFCEVHKLEMYGEDIVWIISSHAELLDSWITFNKSAHQIVSCSKEDYQKVIDGSFIFQVQKIREDQIKTASGLTADEYMDKIINMRNGSKENSKLLDSALAFDALWAIAIAMNNSINKLNAGNYTLTMSPSLDQFLSSRHVQETILDQIKKVDFQGMAGPYSYSGKSSNKDGMVKLMHYQDQGTRLVKVALFDAKTDNLTFFNETDYLWGPDGTPIDHSIIIDVTLSIDNGLHVAITTLATIGIFLGIMFLTFNLVYGKYKFIKLSAPLFNNIIAFGCILCLVSVFLFGVHEIDNPQSAFALVCKARAWTLTIGFSCAFGAMFVKTWRIYKICTNKKLRMKLGPLSNWYLLSLIGAIIFIDLLILVTWELVDPLKHGIEVVEPKVADTNTRFKYYKKVLNVCRAENMVVWLAMFYVYKGILILYGLFLAYETRNVIYAHLNDSRVIGICVYNVVVLSVVGAFLSLLLDPKNYKEMYIVLAVCITFPAVATICLMMFPKIAYRCKTDNLDDTETIANGMTTVRHSIDISTMNAPQIHVTTHVPQLATPEPSVRSKDAKFAYDNKEVLDANAGSDTVLQNGNAKK